MTYWARLAQDMSVKSLKRDIQDMELMIAHNIGMKLFRPEERLAAWKKELEARKAMQEEREKENGADKENA